LPGGTRKSRSATAAFTISSLRRTTGQTAFAIFAADLVFAPSSIPVACLECPQPILWWTDAVYDSMVGYYPGFERRNARRACEHERNAMQRATHVIYASDWAAGVARTQYPEYSSKISVIPFGANIEPVVVPERALQPPYKLLFLGVNWQRKGGSIALEATKCLNRWGIPVTLRVVGCDPPAASHSQHLEPYGFVSKRTPEGRARLHELLVSSDLLLLPTRSEAAGIVFCEASAYGLPIVATDTGGVSTYVVDGINGVTLPSDATATHYASVIADILCNPGMYSRLSRGARGEYETRLNWDVGVQTLLGLARPVRTGAGAAAWQLAQSGGNRAKFGVAAAGLATVECTSI
jgi:glycosyltransferase involved in cell wall biosynthesis